MCVLHTYSDVSASYIALLEMRDVNRSQVQDNKSLALFLWAFWVYCVELVCIVHTYSKNEIREMEPSPKITCGNA